METQSVMVLSAVCIVVVVSGVHLHSCLRLAIIAYGDVMHIMLIVAIVVAVFPIFLTFLMPDYHLGDYQNAVDRKQLSGETQSQSSSEDRDHSEKTH